MRRSLFTRFLISYVIIAAVGFILMGTFGRSLITNHFRKELQETLYDQINYLTGLSRADGGSDPLLSLFGKAEEFTTAAEVSGNEFWLMAPDGSILVCSNTARKLEALPEFNPADSDSAGIFFGTFYDTFSSNYISRYAPVTNGFTRAGYVIGHADYKQVETEVSLVMGRFTSAAAILTAMFAASFLLFEFFYFRPMNAIRKGVAEVRAGNLSHRIELKDKTELTDIANTIDYMASSLQTYGEDQRKFIANVSHDFRSPLTSIKGYIEAILDGTIPKEAQDKYLKIVLNETDRLNKLTQGLLDLNTIDKTGALLQFTTFDILHSIKKILATFEKRCNDKGITFELTFPASSFYVYADVDKIQQVLYNLIDNAIKFSNPGSVIFISAYMQHEKAFISVKDQGVGIPAESLPKIWERFYKSDASRGKDKKGTGLGLSITKDIISAHKENIDVISTEGVGTEFVFSLQPGKKEE
ncbi:MAG: HAMP domain-containing protein [Lachnospiraceae bacterium]|nr:HAMP domain-containing protein [Lachnospiraceae bacterium]